MIMIRRTLLMVVIMLTMTATTMAMMKSAMMAMVMMDMMKRMMMLVLVMMLVMIVMAMATTSGGENSDDDGGEIQITQTAYSQGDLVMAYEALGRSEPNVAGAATGRSDPAHGFRKAAYRGLIRHLQWCDIPASLTNPYRRHPLILSGLQATWQSPSLDCASQAAVDESRTGDREERR
jgi:hypothetical protein